MNKQDELKEAINLSLNAIFRRINPDPSDVISILGSALIGIIQHQVPIEERRVLVRSLCKGIKDNVTTINGN